ncbi:hypothetical protein BAGA_25295 [Bacillus gaemokensis]|uniref:Group-specific protein n=2 Tax=Bacillus gaemokensis TaxID=574375 RepID=A0A073KD40_9BACI|nr:hypothetical protein BAGA_25295 [Bacillus gaemokensis]
MQMGFIISGIVVVVMMIVILGILIPFDRKYVVRKKGNEIDFTKTKVYFRWNVFDTISVCLALYAYICGQLLSILIASELTIQSPYVQFFVIQSPTWTLCASLYLISRISLTLKGIKEIKKSGADWE